MRSSRRAVPGIRHSLLGSAPERGYVCIMCGRVRLSSDVSEIRLAFSIPPERPAPNFPPSWNVAPTDSLPVVRYDAKDGQRSLDMLRWGLIPVLGQGHRGRLRQHQRQGGRDREQAGFRESLRNAGAASCRSTTSTNGRRRAQANSLMQSRSPISLHHGARWLVGELAFAGRRVGLLVRDHHDHTERVVRRAPQPDARGAETRCMAGMARRTAGDRT
jgi:hypothetical protein